MKKRVIASISTMLMLSTLFAGCGNKTNNTTTTKDQPSTNSSSDKKEESAKTDTASNESTTETKEIKHFDAWFDRENPELNQDNDIKKIIAEKIGADCKETWLVGQTSEEAIGMLIASGEYPDFVNFNSNFYDAEALVPLDDYIDKYPNIKNYLSETQWESLRQPDGHIYSIPQFDRYNIRPMDTNQNGEAFWIQTRVLKWAGYPVIETLDELFDLLERYYDANPTMPDGTPNIPFEILAYDWLYFCLENPPAFLDGNPNDGKCIVDPVTYKVSDYNITPTAERYFRKLNEEYKKGYIDPEFITMDHDQFGAKVSSGRVCCFVEQHWDFQTYEDAIKAAGDLNDCTYVPLGITIDKGMKEMYYTANESQTLTGGLSITVSCEDVEGALQFVNDLLSQEILTLRSWGVEGVDYLVGDDGVFYRTQEMRDNSVKAEYKAAHLCSYSYFPTYKGMNLDGINAADPKEQPKEFLDGLIPEVKECLEAYGASTYLDMLDYNEIKAEDRPWYPMWSYVNTLPADSPEMQIFNDIDNYKKEKLPQLVIADDFDSAWAEYKAGYEAKNAKTFHDYMQEAVYSRIELVNGKNVRPADWVAPK